MIQGSPDHDLQNKGCVKSETKSKAQESPKKKQHLPEWFEGNFWLDKITQ